MKRLLYGAVAGAAGTMALDIVTYGDMLLRGRAPSDMPAEVIRRAAAKAGISPLDAPSDEIDAANKNRRSALGALSGYAVGITIGALYGVASPALRTVPIPMKGSVLGAMAMAASDVPATLLEATNPKEWGASGWIADIVPHAVYGLVTAAVMDALDPGPDRSETTIQPHALLNRSASFMIVDIRKRPDDRQIPGSIVADGSALDGVGEMPFGKADDVVLYCGSGNSCVRIAGELRARGYRTVALDGGYKAWTDAGLPTENRISG